MAVFLLALRLRPATIDVLGPVAIVETRPKGFRIEAIAAAALTRTAPCEPAARSRR
jgi:hypothetical protein